MRERTGRQAKLMVFAVVFSALLGPSRCEAGAGEAGREWVNRVLVQIAPGPDALGGRIPGAWYGRDASRITTTDQQAFNGKNSLKIELRRPSGGCSRITTLPFHGGELELSCRVFVPDGQPFRERPAVAIWRGQGELVARAEPVKQAGRWAESTLRVKRPPGNPFYFGVVASAEGDTRPSFYVGAFLLKRVGDRRHILENADFEDTPRDKRAPLLGDFDPALVNAWRASDLNRARLFTKHGVRIASWGKVEYDAVIDWDKRVEELVAKASKRDIDGNRVTRPAHPPFVNRMCHHSPVWHEYQKAGLTRIVADNDALGQDNLCHPSFRDNGGCFCRFCERDFRRHLKARFSAAQLAKLLPCPLDQFSIARHVKAVRPDADDKDKALLDDPLAREFIRCQYMAEKRLLGDIAEAIRQQARSQGRTVPFFGNQGAPWGGTRMPVYSVVIADVVDAQCLEVFLLNPYRNTRRQAWGSLQYRLMRAASCNRKPVWPLLPQEGPRRFPTGAAHHAAEALSNGAVPLLIWSAMSYPPKHVYEAHRRYARLLNEHRALFLDREPLARVALAYSVPTCFWRSFTSDGKYWRTGSNHGRWIGGVARVLEDAHIPCEVVVLGHPDLLDDTQHLAALDRFDVLILTAVDCVSDRQAAAVRRFAERGGRLVVIGNLGARDEECLPRDRTILDELTADAAVKERISVLPDSVVREFMSMKTERATVDRAATALRQAVERGARGRRLIRTNAPDTLWMTLWADAGGRRIALHLVNYDVDVERDAFRPARNASVTLRLPARFEFNRLRLLAPGAPAAELPFERKGETVSFRVPSVRCYAIAVLTTDNELDVANQIATARRNLARAPVAGRAGKPPEKTARAALAEAERLYRAGRLADAEEKATAALEASAALLK